MALQHRRSRERLAITGGGVCWTAADGDQLLIFALMIEALDALAGRPVLTPESALAAFELHFPAIERAAAAVYERGPRGEPQIYCITTADVERLGLNGSMT